VFWPRSADKGHQSNSLKAVKFYLRLKPSLVSECGQYALVEVRQISAGTEDLSRCPLLDILRHFFTNYFSRNPATRSLRVAKDTIKIWSVFERGGLKFSEGMTSAP